MKSYSQIELESLSERKLLIAAAYAMWDEAKAAFDFGDFSEASWAILYEIAKRYKLYDILEWMVI